MFKLMTLNINYYGDKHGPWGARKELIAAAIDELQPDVIALQAVRKDPAIADGRNQAEQLGDLLANHRYVHFAPTVRYADGREDGAALLARVPLRNPRSIELTFVENAEDKNRRALLSSEAQIDAMPLTVVNGHFSWVPQVNERNAQEALHALTRGNGSAVFAGDLNATPDSTAMQTFSRAGWIDAWAQLRHEPGFTFESQQPSLRIDYIWLSPPLAARLRAIDTVIGSDGNGTRLSDHLGLIASFD